MSDDTQSPGNGGGGDAIGSAPGTSRPTALVTGASRGIGRLIAHDLATTHDVILAGRDGEALSHLSATLPGSSVWLADLDGGDLAATFPDPSRLDALVLSAGVIGGDSIEKTAAATWRHVFEVNIVGVAETIRLCLPALRAAGGTIVTLNSGSGLTAGARGGVYAASKFALRALTDSLREEVRPAGIRVTSIHPGRVNTQMQHELVAAQGGVYDETRYLDPESVAEAVRFAIDQADNASLDMLSIRPRV